MTTKTAQAGTIAALAGARAFPPLMVVLFHFSEGHHYSGNRWIDLVAARGYLWVEFFFVLSGFILTHAYDARRETLKTLGGYGAFLRARLVRLYPLHLFLLLTLLVQVLLFRALAHGGGYVSIFDLRWHQDVSAEGFVLSALLLHAWNTMDRLTWNGVSWFVSVEFALCLMFPLLLRLAKDGVWRGLGFVAAGLAGLMALLLTSPHGLDITFHNGVLRGLADFLVGMGLALLFRRAQTKPVPAHVHSVLQLAALGLLLLGIYRTGWSHTRYDIFTVLPMMMLVFLLAFDKGLIAAMLKTRLPQRMGAWSYAIYLGQTTWLLTIRQFEQRLYPAPDTMVAGMRFSTLAWWAEPVGLVIVCILWGALLTRMIEHPATKALRNRFERRLDRSVSATPS